MGLRKVDQGLAALFAQVIGGKFKLVKKKLICEYIPVLKLTTISMRNMVSDRQLKAIHRVERSSLKKEIATGKIIKLATSKSSMHRSQ